MSILSEYEEDLCERFIAGNGKVNPIDGKRLQYGKGPYLGFIALCKSDKFNRYDVDHLLTAELTAERTVMCSSSRSRSPPRSPTRSRSPVRSIPLRPTVSGSTSIP